MPRYWQRELLDAAAVAEPVRDQLAERGVLEAAVHDDRAELPRLREGEVVVERVEVAAAGRVLHELRHARRLLQLRERVAFLERVARERHDAPP